MNSFDPYIAAPGTEKGESLNTVTPNQRHKTLEDLGVVDYAKKVNEEIDEIRTPTGAIRYCKNQLQQSNHPLVGKLLEWVNLSQGNAIWFQEKFLNKELELVEDGLSVNGIVILLEDETKASNSGDVERINDYINSLEEIDDNEAYINFLKENTTLLFDIDEVREYNDHLIKRIIGNWEFILNILPGDDKNKSSFLRNVLGLKSGEYWALTGYTNLAGCLRITEDSVVNGCASPVNENYFLLRCAKKGGSNNWGARFY